MKKLMMLALCMAILGWAMPSMAFETREMRDRRFQDLSMKATQLKYSQNQNQNQAPAAGEGSPMVVALVPEFSYSHHKAFRDNGAFIDSGDSKLGSMALVLTKPLSDQWSVYFLYQYSYSEYDGSQFTDFGEVQATSGELVARKVRNANAYSQFIGLGAKFSHPTAGNFDFNVVEAWNVYRSTTDITDVFGNVERGGQADYDDRLTSLILYWDKDFAINDSWSIDPYLGWRSVWAVVHAADTARLWLHLATGGIKVKYKSGNLGFYFRGGANYRASKDDIPDLATRAVAPGVLHHGWFASYDRTVATWGVGVNYAFSNGLFLDFSYNGMSGKVNQVHSGTAVIVLPF
ncbi:MAG: autotransporter outer membrane beta-barrel domain-containing protein [Deltaproteobacteria bacterium]|jgi:opacity protein-like surface antigen|nr:autotransporter outer membrane beta-barrel domain-containing protein [Deltaproteobacteria bacterium]